MSMHTDIVDLRAFYRSKLGQSALRSISMSVSALWPALPDERLVGLGYCRPFLDRFAPDAERAFAFMPAQQGAVAWPHADAVSTALVFDEELPLADSSVDRVLCIHAFEHAESPSNFLAEAWRVLSPNGRLVIVVPNRRGIWARFDHTPFGGGRPYTRGQMNKALREAGFTVERWNEALFFPPFERYLRLGISSFSERTGRRLWPAFSGVLVVEANKKLYQGLPATNRASRRVIVTALQPQGVGVRDGVGARARPEFEG